MFKILTLIALLGLAATSALAQDRTALKNYFEGRQATLNVDLPATKGTAFHPGDAVVIKKLDFTTHQIAVRLADPTSNQHQAIIKIDTDSRTQSEVTSAIERYVAFDDVPMNKAAYIVNAREPGVVRVGPRTTYLKEGLKLREVLGLLGEPRSFYTRDGNSNVTVYEFTRTDGRMLIAEFVDGVLVRSSIESVSAQNGSTRPATQQ